MRLTTRLLHTSIISTFGRNTVKPMRSAYTKIGLMLVVAVIVSFILRDQALKIKLPQDVPAMWGWLLGVGVLQAMQVLVLNIGRSNLATESSFTSLTETWPLLEWQRWLVRFYPLVGLALCAGIILTPSALVFGGQIYLEPIWIWVGILIASWSAFALSILSYKRHALLGVVTSVIVLGSEINILSQLADQASYRLIADEWYVAACLALIILPIITIANRRSSQKVKPMRYPKIFTIEFEQLDYAWHALKLFRHKSSQTAILSAASLSIITAGWLMTNPGIVESGGLTWALLVCVLCCVLSIDFRGTVRYSNAPEIIQLKGVWYYWVVGLGSNFIISLLVASPLILVICALAESPVFYLASGLSGLLIGTCVGHSISTSLAPATRDITAQFMAASIGLGITWGGYNLLQSQRVAPWAIGVVGSVLAVCLLVLSYRVERQRNPFLLRINK